MNRTEKKEMARVAFLKSLKHNAERLGACAGCPHIDSFKKSTVQNNNGLIVFCNPGGGSPQRAIPQRHITNHLDCCRVK